MKKAISMFFLVLMLIFVFSGCGNRHKFYDLDTTLGDKFTFEIYLSGNMHGMYPNYIIDGDDLKGRICFVNRESETLPKDPLSSFEEVGRLGNTNFYRFQDHIIWVNSNKYLGWFASNAVMWSYKLDLAMYGDGSDYISAVDEAMADILLTENIDYIYRVGSVLAEKKSTDMRSLLERYVIGDFSDAELSSFNESTHTQEDIIQWAKEMLEPYFSS